MAGRASSHELLEYAPTGSQALSAVVASMANALRDTTKNEMYGQEEPRDNKESPRLTDLSVAGPSTTWIQLDSLTDIFSEAFSRLESLHVLATARLSRPLLFARKDDIIAALAQRCRLLNLIAVAAPKSHLP
jgi:hypothetical protein